MKVGFDSNAAAFTQVYSLLLYSLCVYNSLERALNEVAGR